MIRFCVRSRNLLKICLQDTSLPHISKHVLFVDFILKGCRKIKKKNQQHSSTRSCFPLCILFSFNFPLKPPEKAWQREPGAQKSHSFFFCANDLIHTVGNKWDHNKATLKRWRESGERVFYLIKKKEMESVAIRTLTLKSETINQRSKGKENGKSGFSRHTKKNHQHPSRKSNPGISANWELHSWRLTSHSPSLLPSLSLSTFHWKVRLFASNFMAICSGCARCRTMTVTNWAKWRNSVGFGKSLTRSGGRRENLSNHLTDDVTLY